MALVGRMLAPEELGFRRSEQRHDLGLLARTKRTGRDETEKPPNEVGELGHAAEGQADFSTLQSTQ